MFWCDLTGIWQDEASDDDWMGDERSVSPTNDNDEEKKKQLEAYMSQGSGLYKASQQLK